MTKSITRSDNQPRVWIGCLACYNNGKLIGKWFNADEIDEDDLPDMHPQDMGEEVFDTHEEYVCMDHENIPGQKHRSNDLNVYEAMSWGELYNECDSETDWDALCSWVEQGSPSLDKDDTPDMREFVDAYVGHYESFTDYGYQYIDDTGYLNGVPEEITRYFDYEAFIRDLEFDYIVCESIHDTGVHIFYNY